MEMEMSIDVITFPVISEGQVSISAGGLEDCQQVMQNFYKQNILWAT